MRYVELALYELLKDLAGGRVYPMRAEEGAQYPYIVYQQIDSYRWKVITGTTDVAQASIQIDVYSPGFHETKALAAQIENLLDGFDDTVYYTFNEMIDQVEIGVSLQNSEDIGDAEGDPFLYRNSAVYLVTYNQRD